MLTEEDYIFFKKEAKKAGVTFANEEELREQARLMYDLAQLALKVGAEEVARKNRLKDEPNGFAFPGEGRCCSLCSSCIAGNMWYDQHGMRCGDCQNAYEQKIIPGYVFSDTENKKHFTEVELAVKFYVDHKAVRRAVHSGKIKARIIKHDSRQDTRIILTKDNPKLREIMKTLPGGPVSLR